MLRSGVADSYDSSSASFLRKLHTVFPSGCSNSQSHQQCLRSFFFFFCCSYWKVSTLLLSSFLMHSFVPPSLLLISSTEYFISVVVLFSSDWFFLYFLILHWSSYQLSSILFPSSVSIFMTIVLNYFLGNLLIFISLGFFPGFYLVL